MKMFSDDTKLFPRNSWPLCGGFPPLDKISIRGAATAGPFPLLFLIKSSHIPPFLISPYFFSLTCMSGRPLSQNKVQPLFLDVM